MQNEKEKCDFRASLIRKDSELEALKQSTKNQLEAKDAVILAMKATATQLQADVAAKEAAAAAREAAAAETVRDALAAKEAFAAENAALKVQAQEADSRTTETEKSLAKIKVGAINELEMHCIYDAPS